MTWPRPGHSHACGEYTCIIRKRARREHWTSPKEIERRGREKIIEFNKKHAEAETDRWARFYLDAREDTLVAARVAIHRFRLDVENGAVRVKSVREITALLEALKAARGKDEEEPQKPLGEQWLAPLSGKVVPRPRPRTGKEPGAGPGSPR